MNAIDDSMINSWYSDKFTEGFVHSSGQGSIRYSFKQGQPGLGSIVIVPGRTECIEKYMELLWDLRDLDHTICLYDQLGQGKSDRQLEDRNKGHITDFQIYVSDLIKIIETIVLPAQSGPVCLLAHSMGATISVLASQRRVEMISGLILVSPMFQINTGKLLPPFLAELLCNFVCFAGGRSGYVWGGGPYRQDADFKGNLLTTDLNRFQLNNQLIRQNPEVALGSPTFGWLQAAYRAMRKVRRQPSAAVCPTIIFRSLDERVVGLKEMERYCNEDRNCQLVTYRDCRHELLMERDEIRDDLIARVHHFLAKMIDSNGTSSK